MCNLKIGGATIIDELKKLGTNNRLASTDNE